MQGLALVGGALLLLLMISGRKKGKKAFDPNAPVGPGKGGLDEPVGPNGCADGLVADASGFCRLPAGGDIPGGGGGRGGRGGARGGGQQPQSQLLHMDANCSAWAFSDGTGDAWLRANEKVLLEYLDAGIVNPYEIAGQALRSLPCFADYPQPQQFSEPFLLEIARELWLREPKNREAYRLIAYVAGLIDEQLLDGQFGLHFAEGCDVGEVGEFWYEIVAKPIVEAYLAMDAEAAYSFWPPGQAPKGAIPKGFASWEPLWWLWLRVLHRMDPDCADIQYATVLSLPPAQYEVLAQMFPRSEMLFGTVFAPSVQAEFGG